MPSRRYIVTRMDGKVSILNVVQQPDKRWPTVEECLAKWPDDKRTNVASHRPLKDGDLPSDRSFRNAWRDDGSAIGIDMPTARELWRAKMREARAPMLAALDVEYQRADEADDKAAKADIAKRKQALRDVTAAPEIDAAQTPEELKAVWPL